MFIKTSYDEKFDDIYMHLKSKYPDKLFDFDGIGEQLDMNKFSKKFFQNKATTADVSIDENANVGSATVVEYEHELPKPFLKLNSYYILWKYIKQYYGIVVANEIFESVIRGDIYIHDFTGLGSSKPYCFNFSTLDIVLQGLPMIEKIRSLPPKHLYAFKSQIEQFITIASNSILGATGLADMLITTSMFVDKILDNPTKDGLFHDAHFHFASEKDVWIYIKESIISLIYTLNQPMRSSIQSPFTNVSIFDRPALEKLVSGYIFPETGKIPKIETVEKIQNMFLDIMNSEKERTPITFPITTAVISVGDDRKILDMKFLKNIVKKNQKFGFLNVYNGVTSTLSGCCRLRSDTTEFEGEHKEFFNSFGAGDTRIGSLGVVTLNLPRYAKMSKGNREEFFKLIEKYHDDAIRINETKRKLIRKRIENGNQPLYTHGFMQLDRQYSTIGVVGVFEAVKFMGLDILKNGGSEFVLDIVKRINELNDKAAKRFNESKFNCEQVPAENVAVKLVKKDKLLGYLKDEDNIDLYSNQFVPLITNTDMLNRMRLQGIFDEHFSGGSILHLNMEQMPEDNKVVEELFELAIKLGIIYFALNPIEHKCENNHIGIGKIEKCVKCGATITDYYTRVVGFLTNIKGWSKERRELDYPLRKFYSKINFE